LIIFVKVYERERERERERDENAAIIDKKNDFFWRGLWLGGGSFNEEIN
jgi:hypothetical protein